MGRPIVLLDLDDTLVLSHEIEPLRRQAQRRAVSWDAVYATFDRTTLPPGTHELVRWLKQAATVGVVTSAQRVYAERLLHAHGLSLPVVVAYHDTPRHKPDPQPLERALELLHGKPTDAVYIGDDDADATAALNAGLLPIQTAWDTDVEWAFEREPIPGTFRSWLTMRQALELLWAGGGRRVPDTDLIRVDPEHYDAEDLSSDWDSRWSSPNEHATLAYRPLWSSGGVACEGTRLVLDFKHRQQRAVDCAADFLTYEVERHEAYLRDIRQVRYVASIPGHVAGSGNSPVDAVARSLADRFPWLAFEGSIERVHDVPQSSTAAVRPTAAIHAASMRWRGPRVAGDEGVLLVDDVLTRGATFAGARDTVIAATACRSVVGMFLARTDGRPPSLQPIPSARGNDVTVIGEPGVRGLWEGVEPQERLEQMGASGHAMPYQAPEGDDAGSHDEDRHPDARRVGKTGEGALSIGDAVRHQRLGIGVVGESGAASVVVHFFPHGWGSIARTRLELLEPRESLLAMLDGTWHLGADRLKAAVVYLRLDDVALYGPAAVHFAQCPESATKQFLTSYLASVPRPPRVNKMRTRVREVRDAADRIAVGDVVLVSDIPGLPKWEAAQSDPPRRNRGRKDRRGGQSDPGREDWRDSQQANK